MYIAIGIAAALFAADRILKYLSRTGKLKWEGRYVRLTHLENRGFFLGLGQKHEKLLRWLPLGVWLAAAACLLPELGKRAFAAQLGILSVLLGGISNQWDRLRRGSVTAIPPPKGQKTGAGVEPGGLHAYRRRGADRGRTGEGAYQEIKTGPSARFFISPCSTNGSGSSPRSSGRRSGP